MHRETPEPSWWSAAMPERVQNRQEIPNVGELQEHYVRYSSDNSAVPAQMGWNKSMSLQAKAKLRDQEAPGMQAQAPEQIVMEISRAPAEFAVPVKQDRRLKPPFKVKVTMWHKAPLDVPVTVTVHAILQEEYANMEDWVPPAIDAATTHAMVERATPTELKGTTSLAYQFEARGTTPAFPSGTNNGSMPMIDNTGSSNGNYYLPNTQQSGGPVGAVKEEFDSWTDALNRLLDGFTGGDQMGQLGSGDIFAGDTSMVNQYAQEYSQPTMSSVPATERPNEVYHEFEFDKLEFAKPSRMNKVYIVFACQISTLDLLFTVFSVPTICFCRREQKDKAYSKLGIPYRIQQHPGPSTPQSRGSLNPRRPSLEGSQSNPKRIYRADSNAASTSQGSHHDPLSFVQILDDPTHFHPDMDFNQETFSERDVEELIVEQYHNTGLTRPLTRMDKNALLARSGFPQMGRSDGSPPTITKAQYKEFERDWELILRLLRQMHDCWIASDPAHIICGFEMDHNTAVGALRGQPPGTFLCRLSQSQPGHMVLVCKVPTNSPHADEDHLVNGLLNVFDLNHKRVDTWINNFTGATHLLDVYCDKRVDKRKAFPSQYVNITTLERHYPTPAGETG